MRPNYRSVIDQYESVQATANTDRTCRTITECNNGQLKRGCPSSQLDRLCDTCDYIRHEFIKRFKYGKFILYR